MLAACGNMANEEALFRAPGVRRTLTTSDSGLFHDTTPISPDSST